jgi:hypothetical protein
MTSLSSQNSDRPIVQNFSDFWSALKKSEFVKSQEETDVVKWTFSDGTELEVKQEEHSVC